MKFSRNTSEIFCTQQGLGFIGWILQLAIFSCIGLLGFKIMPSFLEYRAIKSAIIFVKENAEKDSSIQMLQDAFDRQAQAGYIYSLVGSQLDIRKDDQGIELHFAYDKEILLFKNVSLLIHYKGSTLTHE